MTGIKAAARAPSEQSTMPIELFNRDGHRCLMFTDLTDAGGDAVQSNQFLIVDGDTGAVIDPGGNLAYSELYLGMTKFFPPSKLTALIASHADPDIIASLDRWTTATQAHIYISQVWERFVPHFCKAGKTTGRIVGIPDAGMRIRVGRHDLLALPAHFLHAEGNFQFYDPVSRILFSGDLGVSLGSGEQARTPATALAPLLPRMEGFHRRYMASPAAFKAWAAMARKLDIEILAPQHGAMLVGRENVRRFIDWIEALPCGPELLEFNCVVP